MAIWIFLGVALLLGFYAAWNIGANDVANAMGTSVGSGALTFRQAVVYAAIFEFLGAFLLGSHVSDTIRKDIVDINAYTATPELLLYGMLAALAASAIWLNIATILALPVSTTHSIVGAIIGFGILVKGWNSVDWGTVGGIVLSWFICPLAAAVVSYTMFRMIRRLVLSRPDPFRAVIRTTPFLVILVMMILTMSVVKKGLSHLKGRGELLNYLAELSLLESFIIASMVACLCGFIARIFLSRVISRLDSSSMAIRFKNTEVIFGGLQILTACFVAFVHGANDVANAIGPLAAIWEIGRSGVVTAQTTVPVWMLILGGAGIVLGIATYGVKVMGTVGKKITEMTPSRGFCAEFGAATTVLAFTLLARPVSTTHALVGGVIGVGYARGMGALDLGVIRRIAGSWVITLPATAVFTIVIYMIIKWVVAILVPGGLLTA